MTRVAITRIGGIRRRLILAAILGLAAFESGAADEIIKMSPFEVVAESVEFEGWKKLRSPNFVVYTDATAESVRPLLQQMEMMHIVAQVLLGRKPLNHQPVHVVLPTRNSDWKELRSRGKVDWKVAVSGESDFSYLCVVHYDWQENGIHVMWTMLSSIETTILGLDWAFPLERGFRYYFETMRPSEAGVKVGAANPRILAVKNSGWLKWDRFFKINSRSPEYRESGSDSRRFAGQAAAFMHYWLAKSEPAALAKLMDWNARLQAGRKPTSAEFEAVFGLTFKEFDRVMKKYVSDDKFVIRNYGIPSDLNDFVVTEIDVTTREMRELFVLVQIKNQRIDDSKRALDSLLARGVETPHLRSLLVSACMDWRRRDDALAVMEGMIEAGDNAAETYVGAAALTFFQNVGPPALDTRLSPEAAAQIQRYVQGAFDREPLSTGTNTALAWTHALVADIDQADLDAIRAACRRMDGHGDTSNPLAALAVAAWRVGDVELARRLVDLLLASPYCDRHARPVMEKLSKRLR